MREFVRMRQFWLIVFSWAFIWIGGCATETLKPTFPTASGLQRPDRVLVYEFVVTGAPLAHGGIVGAGLEPAAAQSEEDIRVGGALAKALAESLVSALRKHGIDASPASEAAPPGEATASIRGRFQSAGQGQEGRAGFALRGKELRTQIQVMQGSGLDLRVVAESEYTMQSNLRPGIASGDLPAVVNAEARRAAQTLADRVADFYRKQGWLK